MPTSFAYVARQLIRRLTTGVGSDGTRVGREKEGIPSESGTASVIRSHLRSPRRTANLIHSLKLSIRSLSGRVATRRSRPAEKGVHGCDGRARGILAVRNLSFGSRGNQWRYRTRDFLENDSP